MNSIKEWIILHHRTQFRSFQFEWSFVLFGIWFIQRWKKFNYYEKAILVDSYVWKPILFQASVISNIYQTLDQFSMLNHYKNLIQAINEPFRVVMPNVILIFSILQFWGVSFLQMDSLSKTDLKFEKMLKFWGTKSELCWCFLFVGSRKFVLFLFYDQIFTTRLRPLVEL